MKYYISTPYWLLLFFFICGDNSNAQKLVTGNSKIDIAFKLAVETIDRNVHYGILAAGADYGGEWTRDISINSWNGVSLLRPETARNSLWSVTINRDSIGHQYWDKILWAISALNHYKVNGDTLFLRQAYECSKKTIESLERYSFDKSFGLFTGPSVFNDGIAAYPEPIFEPSNSSSFVLDHKNSVVIKCLSTNCVYYGAYISIIEMGKALNIPQNILNALQLKAADLKKNILKHLYDSKEKRLNYLIDSEGRIDRSQEALGISFAIIFGIISQPEADDVVQNIHISKFGITSVYPDLPRYSSEKPGRHNNIVWPMVNGFWAKACKQISAYERFDYELLNLADLAVDEDKGNLNFREIYNPYTGKPDGGWQSGRIWESCNHQSWSATSFVSMILDGIFGLSFENEGISFNPYLSTILGNAEITGLKYRNAVLNIKISGSGSHITSFKINDVPSKSNFVSSSCNGILNISIKLENK